LHEVKGIDRGVFEKIVKRLIIGPRRVEETGN
jgi:hypothetical protein